MKALRQFLVHTTILVMAFFISIPSLRGEPTQNPSSPAHELPRGLVTIMSLNSVAITTERLKANITNKGFTILATIDHAVNANSVGLSLSPSVLILFGNPKAGTPLLEAKPTLGIDLPQKFLVWSDENGITWIGYNHPSYLFARHQIANKQPTAKKIAQILRSLAEEASKKP